MVLLEEETYTKLGYYPSQLGIKSAKYVFVMCDRCGKVRKTSKRYSGCLCQSCANKNRKRKHYQLNDYEWLFHKYRVEHKSTREIAKIIGTNKNTVSNSLRRFDISIRKERYIKYHELQDKNVLFQKYWAENKNLTEIANDIGCSPRTVAYALVKYKISIREPSRKGDEHSEKVKQKIREARKHRHFPTHHTKPELIFEAICKRYDLPFKYTGDSSFWISKNPSINPDFIHTTKKIAVEIFSYWHDPLRRHCKVRYSATYEGRKKILKKHGWRLVVFWESDLQGKNGEMFVLATLQKEGII